MSRISSMLDIGKRSMMNSQTALQTVGHNIANKNVDGFSRQRVEIQTNEAIGHGKLRIGTGAKAAAVTRVNNPHLEKQLGEEKSRLGFLDSRADSLARVEQIYNEQINKGLNKFVGEFFNAFRELSNNPESLATRTLVKESADVLVKDFKRVHVQMKEVQKDIDMQIKHKVEEVNKISGEITQLNAKIQSVEMIGGFANDERDRREQLLKDLGQLVNVKYAESDQGVLTIAAGDGGAILVSGSEMGTLSVERTPTDRNKRQGALDIFYKSSETATPIKMTRQMTGGSIGSLIEVRDEIINGFHNQLNDMATTIADEVNELHVKGFDRYSQKGGDFFVYDWNQDEIIDSLGVSEAVRKDPGRIAAGLAPNAPGDNRVANQISGLQYKGLMANGESTVDEFYNSMMGQIGIMSKRAQSTFDTQKDIVGQLSNMRESISGVSLDEEATKIIEYQKAFDASARLIRTADEMLETVINLKRY